MTVDNKLNITELSELTRMKEKISKKKTAELFENVEKILLSTFDEIIEKYVEMNIEQPFRNDHVIIRTELEKLSKIKG